ncbi:MAG: helix-turn-helix domain-containing protein, partial [Dolichospermum sp.]
MPKINELMVGVMSKYGIKSKDLAELIGISAQQIAEFRSGRSWLSQTTFEAMLESMEALKPGSRKYFCSLIAGEDFSITNSERLVRVIENATSEEIE